jgi:hypothetical protein
MIKPKEFQNAFLAWINAIIRNKRADLQLMKKHFAVHIAKKMKKSPFTWQVHGLILTVTCWDN